MISITLNSDINLLSRNRFIKYIQFYFAHKGMETIFKTKFYQCLKVMRYSKHLSNTPLKKKTLLSGKNYYKATENELHILSYHTS